VKVFKKKDQYQDQRLDIKVLKRVTYPSPVPGPSWSVKKNVIELSVK
jgi:hypothetical protein